MPVNLDLLDAIGKFGPHDHLCSIYETQEQQFAVAIPFIRIGLERREKCIYIADDHNLAAVAAALRAEGVDLDRVLASGALDLITKEQAYMKQAVFDPDWMFSFWRDAAIAAESAGFTALRATGETEWVMRGGPGLERWMEYESRLTHTLADANAFALCQYNRSVCPADVILNVIRTHPIVIYGEMVCPNFYFVPAEEFLSSDQKGREVERLLTNIRDRAFVQRELERARDELELRVQQRTAELARANEQLQAEVAERKLREQEVRSLNGTLADRVSELTALNKEMQAFTYSVSHDLGAPLRHMDAYSQLLEEASGQLAPEAQAHLRKLRETVAGMSAMVDDLLSLARTGQRELQREMTGIRSLVDQVLRELKPDTEGREIRFEVGELPFADCDPVLIKQVLSNLIGNAIKFTRPRRPAVIEIGKTLLEGQPAVFVRDNGVGFSMKYADRLFGIFQRLHRREDFEGTGIGLATVQRIIHKHGGRVWAEAELNKGATFYFTWTAHQHAPTERTEAVAV